MVKHMLYLACITVVRVHWQQTCIQTADRPLLNIYLCVCFKSAVHVVYMQLKCNINHIQTSLPC